MERLLQKMVAVQTALRAPKGQYNSFGKYRYRSCEDILEAAKPILAEHGLLLTLTDEMVLSEAAGEVTVGEISRPCARWYVKSTATITDGESSVSCSAYAREDDEKKGMDGSQVTGTASSYARKYALNGLLLIDDAKDADTDQHAQQVARNVSGQESKQTADHDDGTADHMLPVRRLWKPYVDLRGDADAAMDEILRAIGADDMRQLTVPQAAKAEYYMRNYIAAHGGE